MFIASRLVWFCFYFCLIVLLICVDSYLNVSWFRDSLLGFVCLWLLVARLLGFDCWFDYLVWLLFVHCQIWKWLLHDFAFLEFGFVGQIRLVWTISFVNSCFVTIVFVVIWQNWLIHLLVGLVSCIYIDLGLLDWLAMDTFKLDSKLDSQLFE